MGTMRRRSKERLLTRTEVAAVVGCHLRTLQKWQRLGCPVAFEARGKPSLFRERDVRAWLARYQGKLKASRAELDEARARKDRAMAQVARLTFEHRAGNLLPCEDVERPWSAQLIAVRALLLASPSTHADAVLHAALTEGRLGVERTLAGIAREVIREIAA
jgi:phage terminase Nu1 subunit (DNA packaging protein)